MKRRKINFIEVIELGLNLLAQDLVFDSHKEKDLEDYINRFKISKV